MLGQSPKLEVAQDFFDDGGVFDETDDAQWAGTFWAHERICTRLCGSSVPKPVCGGGGSRPDQARAKGSPQEVLQTRVPGKSGATDHVITDYATPSRNPKTIA